jgi:hypothetical protein
MTLGYTPLSPKQIDYALNALEQGGGWSEPAPPAVVAQARRAAHIGVSLDTLLRRYQAG